MIFSREFPLPEQQHGAMLGNGLLGAHLWGEKNLLNMSIGCASLWDHRGGLPWTPEQNFEFIKKSVAAGDIDTIKQVFSSKSVDGGITRPTLIPCGRVVIHLPENAELLRYEIELNKGKTRIIYLENDSEKALVFCADMSTKHGFACHGLTDEMQLKLLPSYILYKQDLGGKPGSLAARGYEPPQEVKEMLENIKANTLECKLIGAYSRD